MSAWVICSSFRVTHAFVKTFAVPLRPNLGVSPVFSKSVAFTLPYVDKEKKAKNIVLLYASKCTNYVQHFHCSEGAEASFIWFY